MNNRYLVYCIVLALWAGICYWMYSKHIFPKIHDNNSVAEEMPHFELPYPVAFKWGSAELIAGLTYDSLVNAIASQKLSSVYIITGGYFLDEKLSLREVQALGRQRAIAFKNQLQLDSSLTIITTRPMEINADVRSNPFKAIDLEMIPLSDLLIRKGDTTEICFPFRDSGLLPKHIINHIHRLAQAKNRAAGWKVNITGIADGTGIAESSDMAVERAVSLRKIFLMEGWTEDQMEITTGQRNENESLRNRCVLIFFERN